MKKKILISAFFMAILSITSAFSMDDSEKTQISVKVRYSNNALFDKDKYNNVSFALYFEDGEKKEKLGSFTFSVGAERPIFAVTEDLLDAYLQNRVEGDTLQSFIFKLSAEIPEDNVTIEKGRAVYHINRLSTYDTTAEQDICSSFSLNNKKPWQVTLYPEEASDLTHLYTPEGISYAMKHANNAAVFNPSEIGLYSFLTVNISVDQDPMSAYPSAQHYLTIGGL